MLEHIYLNSYSFGTLLVTIFTSLLSFFFLTMPNKTKSTFHLGIAFLLLSFFNFGYFFAAFYYHPTAAYHRWLTGGLILPLLIHIGQFFLKYPRDLTPRFTKNIFYVLWGVALIVMSIFCVGTFFSDKKYHFTGHYWDFEAPLLSVLLSVIIAAYYLINFLIIPLWKYWLLKVPERKTIIKMMIALLIAGLVPNFTNIMSRDGSMTRSAYLLSLVLFFVISFFLVSIFYINSTKERSTFMAKIVGLTLVTLLLIMQFWGQYVYVDQENEYNTIKIERIINVINSKLKPSDVEYILKINKEENSQINLSDYPSLNNLDLTIVEIDFKNTVIYEDIHYLPVEDFRLHLLNYLKRTYPYFDGYKKAIIHFLANNSSIENLELKNKLMEHIDYLNRITFIHSNKISNIGDNDFCNSVYKYITKVHDLVDFKEPILAKLDSCSWVNNKENVDKYRREVYKFIRYLKPSLTRHYRKSLDPDAVQKHYISFIYYDRFSGLSTEVGFSYKKYREAAHENFLVQTIILIIAVFFILGMYPLFFKGSLLNPLRSLLDGVRKVNKGELDIEIPIQVRDEIGFLSESFNSMVISIKDARRELQDYADNLEVKVKDRTKELEEKMEEIKKLKVQQDGDYYLTSLLAKPLLYNANRSKLVTTDFTIIQKKQFEFKNRKAELGGDICVTGNIKLGTPDNYRSYVVAMNGDAMGKSMQGAGGSLVMGVMMNSIMKRSAENKKILNKTPEKWLTELYNEVNDVFKTFNGTMVISCVIILVDEDSGEVFYFNAEHPFCVLYRGGDISFMEKEMKLRKLGLDSEFEFEVRKFQLIPGDILILASDGRDDIDLTPNSPAKTINEDDSLFLLHVKRGRGNIKNIIASITHTGELIDDLSILRIGFRLNESQNLDIEDSNLVKESIGLDPEFIHLQAKSLLASGKIENAKILLEMFYQKNPNHSKINKLYAMLCFKTKEYDIAVEVLQKYLDVHSDDKELTYHLSIALKKVGRYNLSLDYGLKLLTAEPENVLNLLNIADVYRLLGQENDSRKYINKILEIDSQNESAKKILSMI